MSVIEVREPGQLTTVQDLGREGFGPMGISPSGAADALSLRLGNRLVGNAESDAALEMTLVGGAFHFPDAAMIALAGSDFGASLDGAPAPLWASLRVRAGSLLQFGATRSGARCYLCVRGGIAVEPLLGSASTHLLSGLGGFDGRALRRGDVLPIGVPSGVSKGMKDEPVRNRIVAPQVLASASPRKILRVTDAPQSDWFPESSRHAFYIGAYRVTEESNRMGLRLNGSAVAAFPGREMLTEGAPLGAIQVPPAGQPIILFVEQQTTGGYPKIANVISADLHSVGQLRPRDEIRFERVDFETAQSLLREQELAIQSSTVTVE